MSRCYKTDEGSDGWRRPGVFLAKKHKTSISIFGRGSSKKLHCSKAKAPQTEARRDTVTSLYRHLRVAIDPGWPEEVDDASVPVCGEISTLSEECCTLLTGGTRWSFRNSIGIWSQAQS